MTTDRDRLLQQELETQMDTFMRSIAVLRSSFEKVAQRRTSGPFGDDVLESIEAFTARFSRAADLLTQKLLPLLDALEREERGSLLDRIQRAEKRGLVNSAVTLRNIRDLRNDISHQYIIENPSQILEATIRLTPELLSIADNLSTYIQRFR